MGFKLKCPMSGCPKHTKLLLHRCDSRSTNPMAHDGYRTGGLDDDMAETLCHVGAPAKLGSTLRQLNQDAVYHLKYYRNKPNEKCEEEIKLA